MSDRDDETVAADTDGSAPPGRKKSPPVIGPAMRQAHERAVAADPRLTGRDWSVFNALQSFTFAWGKLEDKVSNRSIAERAGVRENHCRASLLKLERAGVIVRHKSAGGRPSSASEAWRFASVVGFPPAESRPKSGAGLDVETRPNPGAGMDGETRPKTGPETRPRVGASSEDQPRGTHKTPVVVVGEPPPLKQVPPSAEPEPPAFTELLAPYERKSRQTIANPGRRLLLEAWWRHPEGTEAEIAAAKHNRWKPALLISRIRDGEHLRHAQAEASSVSKQRQRRRDHVEAGGWVNEAPDPDTAVSWLIHDLEQGLLFGHVDAGELADLTRLAESIAHQAAAPDVAQVAGGRR